MTPYELSFRAMGSPIRLVIGEPLDDSGLSPEIAAEDSRRWLHDFDARMSRFQPGSELCRLNADRHEAVPASALLRATVSAGLWSARRSGGLVDPTLLDAIERAGYQTSLDGVAPASLEEALAAAPARRAAVPAEVALWRMVSVDEDDGVIHRPPGVRIDSGGAGKGLSADALAHRLSGYERVAISCGGDVRVVGPATRAEPFEIEIEHPFTREAAHKFWLGDGAIATSGINTRIWRLPDGRYGHHLLDPSTGEPAWTGLIQATAIGTSALEAETLSKMALLSGPERAREILAPFGGALIHDSGELELIGSLRFEEVTA